MKLLTKKLEALMEINCSRFKTVTSDVKMKLGNLSLRVLRK